MTAPLRVGVVSESVRVQARLRSYLTHLGFRAGRGWAFATEPPYAVLFLDGRLAASDAARLALRAAVSPRVIWIGTPPAGTEGIAVAEDANIDIVAAAIERAAAERGAAPAPVAAPRLAPAREAPTPATPAPLAIAAPGAPAPSSPANFPTPTPAPSPGTAAAPSGHAAWALALALLARQPEGGNVALMRGELALARLDFDRRIVHLLDTRADEAALASAQIERTLDRLLAGAPRLEAATPPPQSALELQLDAFLWRLGLRIAHGELLPVVAAAPGLRLRRWRDFGEHPQRSLHMRWAAHLTRRVLAPAEARTLAGIEQRAMNAFLNAAALCGLLDYGRPTAPPPAAAATSGTGASLRSLVRSLRASLGLGGARNA